jgi:hypothetical protein
MTEHRVPHEASEDRVRRATSIGATSDPDQTGSPEAPEPAVQRLQAGDGPPPPSDMLALQGALGNHLVAGLLSRTASAGQTGPIGAEGGPVSQDLEDRIQHQRGGGATLDAGLRAPVETSLGADLSDVRIHTGAESDDLNAQLGARAFTTGSDIFLSSSTSPSDQGTVAHELTHVVQQRSMSTAGPLTVGAADDEYEQAADRVAGAVQSGQAASTGSASRRVGRLVQREPEPEGEAEQEDPLDVDLQGVVEDLDDPEPESKVGNDTGVAESTGRSIELGVNADLILGSAQRSDPIAGHGRKHDTVTDGLTVGSTVTRGGVAFGPTDFGDEVAQYKADTISWTRDAGKKTVNIVARMLLDIHWDTQSRGRTPVTSERDAAVTAATWSPIADDLEPDGTGRPTRDTYWAPDLTERHEKFHASDDLAQATLFLPTVKAWLDAQTITMPAPSGGMFAPALAVVAINRQVNDLVEQARQRVKADGWAYYHAGGEDRAYADGKDSYQGRVDAIRARAVTEKWP